MMAATLQRPAVPPMAYRLSGDDKEACRLLATAALSAILVTLSRTDDGRRSWILTRGPRTVEVTSLQGLAAAIAEMRGA